MELSNTPYEIFERETRAFYNLYHEEYRSKVERANKDFKKNVHFKYKTKISQEDHQQVQHQLGSYMHFVSQTKTQAGEEGKDYISLFNEKINTIEENEHFQILQNLGKLQALNDLLYFISSESNKYFEASDLPINPRVESKPFKSTIHWTGKTKIHFIQLIYALHQTGCLTNEEKQITTLVKQVAEFFNYDLGDSWQSLLSDNVNNRSSNYESSFFKNLADGYVKHCTERLAEKKKK